MANINNIYKEIAIISDGQSEKIQVIETNYDSTVKHLKETN